MQKIMAMMTLVMLPAVSHAVGITDLLRAGNILKGRGTARGLLKIVTVEKNQKILAYGRNSGVSIALEKAVADYYLGPGYNEVAALDGNPMSHYWRISDSEKLDHWISLQGDGFIAGSHFNKILFVLKRNHQVASLGEADDFETAEKRAFENLNPPLIELLGDDDLVKRFLGN